MFSTARKTVVTITALGALALGGAADRRRRSEQQLDELEQLEHPVGEPEPAAQRRPAAPGRIAPTARRRSR